MRTKKKKKMVFVVISRQTANPLGVFGRLSAAEKMAKKMFRELDGTRRIYPKIRTVRDGEGFQVCRPKTGKILADCNRVAYC